MTVAVLGLAISAVMLLGILRFRPLFDEINQAHQALIDKQEQLSKANLELEAFSYTVSHDLRTPLGVICGYAGHLRQSYGNRLDAQALKCLDEIEAQGFKMAALMENLLTLAKTGYIERPSQPVDANHVVDEVLCELSPQIAGKQAKITCEGLPAAAIPEPLLAEIFRNLIGNALHYACAENGAIEVGGEKRAGHVRMYVRDHGPGIPKGEQPRIFEKFYRGSTGNVVDGTGIGLAIVQKIAHLYGGRAWVEDTPGGGSTFVVEVKESRP
jgi:signal transduction histidine kinase